MPNRITNVLMILVGIVSGATFGQADSNHTNNDKARFFSTLGAEWFLSHASTYKTLGAYISEKHAVEVRHEFTYAGFGRFEGRTIRMKSFWASNTFYSTIGIHSYEATIAYDTGELQESSWGIGKKYEKRTAWSIGPQVAIGAQWHVEHLVLGVEYLSLFHATNYFVDGVSPGPASKNAVKSSKNSYRLDWPLHTPQIFVGIAI